MRISEQIEKIKDLLTKQDWIMWKCVDGHILGFTQDDIKRNMVPSNGALVGFCFPKITSYFPTSESELIILSRNAMPNIITALEEAKQIMLARINPTESNYGNAEFMAMEWMKRYFPEEL